MIVNMDLLRKNLPRTYRTVCRDLDLFLPSEEIDIDLNDRRLASFSRGELTAFYATQKQKTQQPAPPPPVVEPPKPAPELPEQISMADLEAENQRDIQARADTAAAVNRLNEYAAVGLEDTPENVQLIKDFVNNSAVKYWSSEIVDVAIKALGNTLSWRKEAPPAPTPVVEPVEVLGNLPNGEPRLPLDIDNSTLRRASREQARDWNKRANGKMWQPRPSGSFGSKF
jgi:hypothetical protein